MGTEPPVVFACGGVGRRRRRQRRELFSLFSFFFFSQVDGIVPQSVIARRSSGLSRKSRKPVLWMPTYDPFLVSCPF